MIALSHSAAATSAAHPEVREHPTQQQLGQPHGTAAVSLAQHRAAARCSSTPASQRRQCSASTLHARTQASLHTKTSPTALPFHLFLLFLLISFAALSFASRLACVTLSRLLSHPLFFPWPMGTVHCAWLRSSASATVVFPFSPPLLALGPLARQGSRSWRHASASPGGRRCEPRAGAAVAHVTYGNSR